jgi:hypothetical protein
VLLNVHTWFYFQVDLPFLERQVAEKRAERDEQERRDLAFAQQMIKDSNLAVVLEAREMEVWNRSHTTLTGWPRRLAARTARRRAVLDCVACAILIHTFVSVASRAAVHRCAWLDKYIAMRLFQSLDASQLTPCEYSHRRMSRGQAVTSHISV